MIVADHLSPRDAPYRHTSDHFGKYGWSLANGFFDSDEAASITRFTDELLGLREVAGAQMVYREQSLLNARLQVTQRIENFCPHHAAFDALVRGGRLQAAVTRLFGEPAILFKDKINFKMPGGAGFEAHQDQQAGWSRYAPIFITAMVTIDDTTVANGCLEIATIPRLERLIGAEWEPLPSRSLAALKLESVATGPGDVIFFDSFVPHSSKANLTASPRRVLYVTYNRLADGDQRERYYADKRAAFPPDIERQPGTEYRFRV